MFVAGTMDDNLRAFDIRTGAGLWKGKLPAGGQATRMTYRSPASGRQIVVIAVGGHVKGCRCGVCTRRNQRTMGSTMCDGRAGDA